MSKLYVAAVRECGHAVDTLERALEARGGELVTLPELCSSAGMTADQALLTASALEELGVLRRTGDHWRRIPEALEQTRGFRQGVQAGVRAIATVDQLPEVLALAPDDSSAALRQVLMKSSLDLRFGLLAMITESAEELLVMSPFWDRGTVTDLGDPLRARIRAGVKVILVTRHAERPLMAFRDELATEGKVELVEWFRTDGGGRVSTFHLKALVQDRGRRAYVGSANMTTESLRSRMELGFRFDGALARRVAEIVYTSVGLRCGSAEAD